MKKIDNIEYKRIDYEKYADIIKNLTDELTVFREERLSLFEELKNVL